jgi:hypothetical protein
MATHVLDQIRTRRPYNPNTSDRLTPIEAIDGLASGPCHTNRACTSGDVKELELLVPLLGFAIVGEQVAD